MTAQLRLVPRGRVELAEEMQAALNAFFAALNAKSAGYASAADVGIAKRRLEIAWRDLQADALGRGAIE